MELKLNCIHLNGALVYQLSSIALLRLIIIIIMMFSIDQFIVNSIYLCCDHVVISTIVFIIEMVYTCISNEMKSMYNGCYGWDFIFIQTIRVFICNKQYEIKWKVLRWVVLCDPRKRKNYKTRSIWKCHIVSHQNRLNCFFFFFSWEVQV